MRLILFIRKLRMKKPEKPHIDLATATARVEAFKVKSRAHFAAMMKVKSPPEARGVLAGPIMRSQKDGD
jgi:hypothetical protein